MPLYFLRAIERTDGAACHHGTELIDLHDDLDAAVAHLREVGTTFGKVIVFVHHLDGRVEEVARIGLEPRAAPAGAPTVSRGDHAE